MSTCWQFQNFRLLAKRLNGFVRIRGLKESSDVYFIVSTATCQHSFVCPSRKSLRILGLDVVEQCSPAPACCFSEITALCDHSGHQF